MKKLLPLIMAALFVLSIAATTMRAGEESQKPQSDNPSIEQSIELRADTTGYKGMYLVVELFDGQAVYSATDNYKMFYSETRGGETALCIAKEGGVPFFIKKSDLGNTKFYFSKELKGQTFFWDN